MTLENIIKRDFLKFSIPSDRAIAIETMKKNDIPELIALKEGTDTFLGIININDILSKPEEEQLALIMRREVPLINIKDNIEKAISLFLSGDYYYLPVVENSDVVGIISLKEILPLVNKKYKIKKLISEFIDNNYFMSVWENTPTYIASKIMLNFKVSFLGVLNNEGKFVGLLDTTDMIRAGEIISGITESDATKGESGDDWDWNWKASVLIGTSNFYLPNKPVSNYLKKGYSTINQNLPISQAIELFHKEETRYIAVIGDNNVLIGILRDIDILKAFKDLI
ncbi:MAG: inosine 5'-monophosphate dehydrogenase [Candidatus Methanofastidiosum methylothiophilum]|uniref:Inosine 5'-monophosphate dehydrogenase n=1 Tax=Candidatus Methanofastidiosum methylothiophilum TaxID=1705564 RepID=A0A150IS64_9EURY|nr:MAG: inosine 5'-monophosphate dehydrogenase [Candidatus Methanofastidiosum methylthiophilus]KYC47685.1 MAG: inosine 5'-monophosphate dehydrogenase [Candidatus Methanofastidiosum methylthiophilus]KYC50309.1 MAG: inosine 5'-monophosphate dehydrogenase [Candidatus Methanofastidiosum methylthiophilus]